MHEEPILALGAISLMAIACQWLAWRLRLPAILFLLLAGVAAGPVTGWLNPEQVFGALLLPIISLSVAVILFEGSLTLRFHEIRGLETIVRRLLTVGVLVTWLIITVATHRLLDFSWKLSCLFGAITVVTGPTVITPMLRTVRPTARVANILRWEGIVIDPVGALLGVLVFQFIVSEADSTAVGQTLAGFFKALTLSTLIGCLAGYGFGLMLRHHWLPEYLHNVASLALVFGVYVASNAIQHESGLLAVTVAGVWLANMRRVRIEDILNFKESLSILLISGLFIVLAARIDFERFVELGWAAAGVFLAIQFVATPVKTFLACWGTPLSWRERALIAWMAPRGIVAAATAAVFAARFEEHGYKAREVTDIRAHLVLTTHDYVQAELLVPLTFMVIIGTVALQSATSRFLALRLGVAEPEPRGFLIVGGNAFGRAIAKVLRECEFDAVVADTDWEYIRTARMEGLDTYYGSVLSEHAEHHLNLAGIGRMLAVSDNPEINELACQHYRDEFGRQAVYSIRTEHQPGNGALSRFTFAPDGRLLFGEETTINRLLDMLRSGAKIHRTVLTEQHDFGKYLETRGEGVAPLFVVNPKGSIEFFEMNRKVSPKAEWVLVSLVPPEALADSPAPA